MFRKRIIHDKNRDFVAILKQIGKCVPLQLLV